MKLTNPPLIAGILIACASPAIAASYPAGSLTYTASRSVGAGHVDLTIVTLGHLGVLGESSFLDWNITVSDAGGSHVFLGPMSGPTSFLRIMGGGLRATSTELLFDFSWVPDDDEIRGGGFTPAAVLFQFPSIGQGGPFYTWQAEPLFSVQSGEGLSSDFIHVRGAHIVERTGEQVVATIAQPLPEPSTWITLIAGFGLIGLALRRRRRVEICA